MTTSTLRAVIYSRNSSARQKSIREQTAENRDVCRALGWDIVAELDDPVSASRYATKVRHNWAALLELLPNVDVIVLWEPSRGDRSLASWAMFLDDCREHRVRVHAVTHARTYDPARARDYRSLAEDGVDSVYESDKISERTLRGLTVVLAEGRPHGALAHGYRRHYDAKGNFVEQTVDPDSGPVVERIFASVAEGMPLRQLCIQLVQEGVPTPRGGQIWRPSTIVNILRNPAYRPHPAEPDRGCRTHKGQVVDQPASWPPLVSETIWQAAQRVIGTGDDEARARRRASAPGAVKYLLSGSAALMTAACGATVGGYAKSPDGRGAAYACNHDRCASAPMAECDEYVTQLVVARLSRRDARHMWAADDSVTRRAADDLLRLRSDLATWRAQLDDTSISVDPASFGRREAALKDEIAKAELRARPAGMSIAALKLLDAAQISASRVRPTWEALPIQARREVVGGMFSSLVLHPATTRLTRWAIPEERLAVVAERITHEWRTT